MVQRSRHLLGVYRRKRGTSKGNPPRHRPQFGKNSDRVFCKERALSPRQTIGSFFSVDLEGNDERLHVTSDWATEYSISGNGRWLAFIERFHVYVLPLVSTGDVVHLSPDQKALPMLRATEEAGQWIHFGSKSDTLHWTLGDRFYSTPFPWRHFLTQRTRQDHKHPPRILVWRSS